MQLRQTSIAAQKLTDLVQRPDATVLVALKSFLSRTATDGPVEAIGHSYVSSQAILSLRQASAVLSHAWTGGLAAWTAAVKSECANYTSKSRSCSGSIVSEWPRVASGVGDRLAGHRLPKFAAERIPTKA